MIPLYILGLLLRYGPQHGYQLKKIISEELEDFTQIKLPSIYYHLEGMAKSGLLTANNEKSDSRPERTVYSVTEKGKKAFARMLQKQLAMQYRPVFDNDAIFYFANELPPEEVVGALEEERTALNVSLATIERHRLETMSFVPPEAKTTAEIIFSHHELHYRAELDWVETSLERLKGEKRV